jgi:hypothetical protein
MVGDAGVLSQRLVDVLGADLDALVLVERERLRIERTWNCFSSVAPMTRLPLGGIKQFLAAYLEECLVVGYPWGALEQEAKKMEKEILG